MPRSGQVEVDQKHYARYRVFRADPDKTVEVVQGVVNGETWGSPNIYPTVLPTVLSAIDAECWANALMWAAKRSRQMNEYTGRRARSSGA